MQGRENAEPHDGTTADDFRLACRAEEWRKLPGGGNDLQQKARHVQGGQVLRHFTAKRDDRSNGPNGMAL